MISAIVPFDAIAIDKTEIPQCDLDIQNKVRSNLFSWNGQFSPQFIETLLNTYAHDGDNVIDPFAGSGTTLCEAARKGLAGYGMELNVSAYFMAKTYELINRTYLERQALVSDIVRILAVAVDSGKIIPAITDAINIYDGFLHFENSKSALLASNDSVVSATARGIAVRMLREKAEMRPNSGNIDFVLDAIEKAQKANMSDTNSELRS